MYDLGAVNEAT